MCVNLSLIYMYVCKISLSLSLVCVGTRVHIYKHALNILASKGSMAGWKR